MSDEEVGAAIEVAAQKVYATVREMRNPFGKSWGELTDKEQQEAQRLAFKAIVAFLRALPVTRRATPREADLLDIDLVINTIKPRELAAQVEGLASMKDSA